MLTQNLCRGSHHHRSAGFSIPNLSILIVSPQVKFSVFRNKSVMGTTHADVLFDHILDGIHRFQSILCRSVSQLAPSVASP